MDKVTFAIVEGGQYVSERTDYLSNTDRHIDVKPHIIKPSQKSEMEEKRQNKDAQNISKNTLTIYRDRMEYSCHPSEIHYIRAFNGYSELMIGKLIFRKDISLTQLNDQLDDVLFFRVSRQYIVNMTYISHCGNGWIEVGEKRFQISRRHLKEFQRKYVEFEMNKNPKFT